MAIATDMLQQNNAPALTDTLLLANSDAGTTQLSLAQAAAFFGGELIKTGNPVGAALSNKAALSAQKTVEKTGASNRTVELAASELPAFIAALPRLLTENLILQVSGTLAKPLNILEFYGPGSIRIVAGTLEGGTAGAAVFQKPVAVRHCLVPVQFWACLFQQTAAADNADSALLNVTQPSFVRVNGCEFAGTAAKDMNGVSATYWASVMLEECKTHECAHAVYASRNSFVLVVGNNTYFYENAIGAYVWRGGIVQMEAPNLLGGNSNLNSGGTIIKGNQFVSNSGTLTP